MDQKTFMRVLRITQNLFLAISIIILIVLPILLAYNTSHLPDNFSQSLFFISLFSVMLVMIIRPLSNLFPKIRFLASLVILRKGLGAFSASIIVAMMLSRLMTFGFEYIKQFLTIDYWSPKNITILAHLGDITAVLLLITSNNFSKRVLKKNWKRLQKLAYVYFYAGALYEIFAFHNTFAFFALAVVTFFVLAAFAKNYIKKHHIK